MSYDWQTKAEHGQIATGGLDVTVTTTERRRRDTGAREQRIELRVQFADGRPGGCIYFKAGSIPALIESLSDAYARAAGVEAGR